MYLKVFLKLKKILKTFSPGQIYFKKNKKNQKKTGFFPTLPCGP
jgi:hypothetical protein